MPKCIKDWLQQMDEREPDGYISPTVTCGWRCISESRRLND
jgi:hypothetical protein